MAYEAWLDNIRDDMNMTEEMVENQNVWHMRIKAVPIPHGEGLLGEIGEQHAFDIRYLQISVRPNCLQIKMYALHLTSRLIGRHMNMSW